MALITDTIKGWFDYHRDNVIIGKDASGNKVLPLCFINKNGVPYGLNEAEGGLPTCPEEHHTSFSEEYTADANGDISATSIITPTSGKKISIHFFHIYANHNTGTISLDFLTSPKKVMRLYLAKNQRAAIGQTHDFGAIDEVLTLTADNIGNLGKMFIKVQYVEKN